MAESRDRMPNWIGRLLCWLGLHDYRLIEDGFVGKAVAPHASGIPYVKDR